jgi:DNA replication protein DnaC
MSDLENPVIRHAIEDQLCLECHSSYEAKVIYIFEHRHSRGLCPECTARGIQEDQDKDAQSITAKRREWRLKCGIPGKYQNEDFSTFDPTFGNGNISEVLRRCREYAEGFPVDYDAWLKETRQAYPSMVLFSPWQSPILTGNGNGKSHMATSIGHRVLDRWKGEDISLPVRFIAEPTIYEQIQRTYSFSPAERQSEPSEQEIINALSRVRLLIIDDLGKQPRNDMSFVRRTLYAIINARYTHHRPVVITCNKNVSGLREYLGEHEEATLDRIIEMTGRNFIEVKGPSYRRRK